MEENGKILKKKTYCLSAVEGYSLIKGACFFIFALSFLFKPLFAFAITNCKQETGGECLSIGICELYKKQFKQKNQIVQSLPSKDCDPNASLTCCVSPQKIVTCDSQGGICKMAPDKKCSKSENSIGQFDCEDFQTCCVKIAEALQNTCINQGGICQFAYCNVGLKSISQLNCPNNYICCVQAPAGCTASGGHCAKGCVGNEQEIGVLDCKDIEVCCKLPTTAPVPEAATGTEPAGGAAPSAGAGVGTGKGGVVSGAILLPACIADGNCTLNDIVQTGVNFATFLLGLSGALFFIIFIYGGGLYLVSFGKKDYVEKGKKIIRGATLGLVLVMGAWTIVTYLVKYIAPEFTAGRVPGATTSGQASEKKKTCADLAGEGYKCTALAGKTKQSALQDAEKQNLTCQSATGFCPNDPNNVLCCKAK